MIYSCYIDKELVRRKEVKNMSIEEIRIIFNKLSEENKIKIIRAARMMKVAQDVNEPDKIKSNNYKVIKDKKAKKGEKNMIQLNESGFAWRNYLFANHDSYEKDIGDFKIRVELIGDSKEQWMEELLKQEPNEELIKECKEDITFQKEQLTPMLQEFVEYCIDRNIETETVEEMLENICQHDYNNEMYRIIEEWEDIGKAADDMWDILDDRYGRGLNYMRDDLCELFMDTVQNSELVRNQMLNKEPLPLHQSGRSR